MILALGAVAAIIPQKKNDSIELNERELLREMLLSSNYISTDQLAQLLIEGDPSVRLIDVRPAAEFKDPLPRAINIPIDSMFAENYAWMFDQNAMKNVIYAEDNQRSTQVWMIARQKGFKHNYLLKGGLQAWKQEIIDPKKPPSTAPQEAHDLYLRRMAARQYFTGDKALPKVDFKPMAPVKSVKKKRVKGGCS